MGFIRFLFSKAFLKQLVLALIVLVVLVFLVLFWLKSSTNHDQRIAVPDLSKMTLDLVEQELENANLRYKVQDSANFNPDYPKYSVIEQSPAAGKFVKENRQIYLVLNPSDYRKIEVPDIVGRTKRQATPTLEALDFKVGTITYKPYIAEDEVLEMRHDGEKLQAGDRLPRKSVIDLVLGDGSKGYNPNGNNAAGGEQQGDEGDNTTESNDNAEF
ncbi:MAG: serine/threonine protein kinase [Cytophagaceae bacterium]|nr:serine/threonine protein kinase [Cytophagaceae bacterium]|tara:strand:+ start:2860 stop:3504 length:645 start_codon:yes stop_codon:yes gene_type:complete